MDGREVGGAGSAAALVLPFSSREPLCILEMEVTRRPPTCSPQPGSLSCWGQEAEQTLTLACLLITVLYSFFLLQSGRQKPLVRRTMLRTDHRPWVHQSVQQGPCFGNAWALAAGVWWRGNETSLGLGYLCHSLTW